MLVTYTLCSENVPNLQGLPLRTPDDGGSLRSRAARPGIGRERSRIALKTVPSLSAALLYAHRISRGHAARRPNSAGPARQLRS
jgi:hypothetical protein